MDVDVIQVNGLTVKYKDFCAVDQLSFSVSEQEIFGIVGPNGAGKTSTVECIGGLRRAYSGQVKVMGLDPWRERKELYGVMGVQLQDTAYQDRVRVWEICDLFASLYPQPVPYGELLEIMQLSDKRKAFVSGLSGGQKQKLSVVLALIANPRVAFLDELTTGLDPGARRQMWDLLLQLRERGLTIVLVSHFMDEVEAICDRVAIMDRGRMLGLGPIGEVVNQFGLQTEISFRTPLEQIGGLEKLPGVVSVRRSRDKITLCLHGDKTVAAVLQYMWDQRLDYRGLAVKPPDLESVFLNLVGYGAAGKGRPRADLGGWQE